MINQSEKTNKGLDTLKQLGIHDHLDDIFRSLVFGITIMDSSFKILFSNEKAAKFLGYPDVSHFLNRDLTELQEDFELFDEEGTPFMLSNLPGRRLIRGESYDPVKILWRNKKYNKETWIEFSTTPLNSDHPNFVLNVFRDITEKKRVQKEYERTARRNQRILESITDGFFTLDKEWKFTYMNKQAEAFFPGRNRFDLAGKNIFEEYPQARESQAFQKLIEALGKNEPLRHSGYFPDLGKWIEISVYPTQDGLVIYLRDITYQKTGEEVLRASEERFRAMIENSSDGTKLLDEKGNITYSTKACERILGFSEQEVLGRNMSEFIYPDDKGKLEAFLQSLLKTERQPVNAEFRALTKLGAYKWIEVVGNNLLHLSSIKSIVVNLRDVTERKKIQESLQYQYHHDHLTDLPNRTYLNERLTQALEEADARCQKVALLIVDLDRFKQINESLGHAIGDRLIQEVALRLRTSIEEKSTLARLGGDEFGILVDNVETEEVAANIASKILEEFKPAFYLDNNELFISPSIGISLFPYDGKEPSVLFKNAETALYRAKDRGRNTYQFYTGTMNATSYEKLTMESKLRHAVDNNEFVLFYQPQIDVNTGKIVGTEELVRWQRPDMSLVLPDRFIPLVESNGLIEPIGEWVLKEALKQAKIWYDRGFKLVMAINLSARQFKQKNFEQILINSIEESGVDPSFIEFELTESVLAENPENVMNIMNALRERGVRFCLDDFSTGYSSLRYIKQFPVDMLKIERNFLKDIPMDLQNSAIAKSIITLGQTLGMEVTAEGVESKKQLQFLRKNLCNRAQGYLFNGAMPAHSLSEILGEDRYISVIASLEKSNPVS